MSLGLLFNKDFHIPVMPRHPVEAESQNEILCSESGAGRGSLACLWVIWNDESVPCDLSHFFALPFSVYGSLTFTFGNHLCRN